MGRRISSLQDADVGVASEIGSKYSDVKTVADSIALVTTLAGSFEIFLKYLGPGEVPPTLRLDGQPIEDGDYYFHKTDTEEAILYYDISEDSWYTGSQNIGGGSVISVNGDTGVVVLTKSSIGLDQVQNTSDANKEISTAVASALSNKLDVSAAYDDTAISAAVALNTAKETNVVHPLVEKAVPSNAIFTDTVYDDTSIQSDVDSKIPLSSKGMANGVATLDGSGKVPISQIPSITVTKSDISDFSENDYATGAEGALASTALQDITTQSINNLSDVFSSMVPTDGQILTYDSTNGWQAEDSNSGSVSSWGDLTGTLSSQTDLQSALDSKQDTLVSGTDIKTINGTSILGAGNVVTPAYDDSDVLKDADTVSPVTGVNKIITQADVTGGGDMSKSTYDTGNTGVVDNAEKVNNLTVETAVPPGALFTDTIYNDTAIQAAVGLNTAKVGITPQQSADIITNNAKVSNVAHPLVEKAVPSNAVFTDTTYTNVSEFINDAGYLTSGAEGDSAYDIAVSNGFVGDETAWLTSLVGATGATGSSGSDGAQGIQGIQGVAGADGADGINIPTEVVTELPGSPTSGTLYIVIPS